MTGPVDESRLIITEACNEKGNNWNRLRLEPRVRTLAIFNASHSTDIYFIVHPRDRETQANTVAARRKEEPARRELLADARDRDACTHARVCRTQCRKVKGVGGWIDRAGGSTSVLSLVRFRRARSVIGLSADRTIGTITRNNINSHGGGARGNVIINDSVSLRRIPDGSRSPALRERYLVFANYN